MTFSHATSRALEIEPKTQVRQRPPRIDSVRERQRSLRALAVETDAHTSVELSLAVFWKELALGLCKVVDCYFGENRCYVLTRPAIGPLSPVPERSMEILQAVLNEGGQKVVAIERQISPSSVAGKARLALNAIGASCKPSLAHPLLILAAGAAQRPDSRYVGLASVVEYQGGQVRVVSITRPDARLAARLSRAEFAVARYLFEGLPQVQIARERRTSQRTVANQIASVFRRLRVSGRGEFLRFLLAQPSPSVIPPVSRPAQNAD